MNTESTSVQPELDYRTVAEAILGALRHERDRQIVAARYSLGAEKRQTLEKIGGQFGITRERVRQIEKSATTKLQALATPELQQIDALLKRHLEAGGNIRLLKEVATAIGAKTPSEQTYISFLATLAPSVHVIDDSDHYHAAISLLPEYDRTKLKTLSDQLTGHLKRVGKPMSIDSLHSKAAPNEQRVTIENLARASKHIEELDGQWGLSHWPEVNPRSIRDKTYLVLNKHGQPLHFSEIAGRIADLGSRKRNVTVQAVHNELIKDPRFVLVGRGIYALADWGYTPGTVADIITDVLKAESPLHKDEIVRRVLKKRQVKTTTIVLNLQEKDQFERVAKATYALR